MYIPAGGIAGGHMFMSASFPVAVAAKAGIVESTLPIRVKGRVEALKYFTKAAAGCYIGVSANDGSVIGAQGR
ncbi:hypothetical protein KSP39_PZI020587 [Platanthera zijinensis]|uniref:Uncharacterized protein n=1 Tax=Platanthera zijinensis TaxID=2320716 RepID=A0AAP0AZC0_9ASPA